MCVPTEFLVPADLTLRWRQYLDGTRDLISFDEWEQNRKRLRLKSTEGTRLIVLVNECREDVRYGSNADLQATNANVCFVT